MHLTEHRAWTLAHTAHALRPEWQPTSFLTILQRAHQQAPIPATNYLHALQALIAYATARNPDGTPTKQTPAFYPTPGPWWTETAPNPGVARAGASGPACEEHPEEPAAACRCCWADVKVGERSRDMVGRRLPGVAVDGP